MAGEVEGAAVLGVVEDEDFEGIWVHLGIPLQWGWWEIGVNFAEAVFSDDVVVFCFLFSIRYFFGKDYAVFEMVARFVGQ